MIQLLARMTAALSGALVCLGAHAVEAPLNLCTGAPEGSYVEVGRSVAKHANPRYLAVTVVETSGSVDNMQRMSRGECGAAIVQTDAYLVYQSRHKDRPVEVTRNRFLYAEFAHLVCRRDANVSSTEDLLANPGRHTVLAGAEGSGSALTWHAFTILDRRYGEVKTKNTGGEGALDSVLSGDAQCLFFVSALGSEFAENVNRRGEDLRLVSISDDVLRSAKFGAVTLYELRQFPKGVYGNLDAGLSGEDVETLSVGATLVIDRHWAERFPNGPAALLGAVTGATPTIDQRATAGEFK